MSELCSDLLLSIYREDNPDPKAQGKEQIRIKLVNELWGTQAEAAYQINQTTHQSKRYHIKEAVVIALRQAVSEAFRLGLITDGVTEPATPKQSDEVDVDFDVLL